MKWTRPPFRRLLRSKLPYRSKPLCRSALLYLSESLIKSLCIRAYSRIKIYHRDKACLFVARRNLKKPYFNWASLGFVFVAKIA